ncbi:hypothetical protein Zmor_003065 [Zophobas morio]|uniref:Uncharacterized protein n=1 Tax=Zophobas morio TaxID=2755281 RepID=A0AA38HLX1_9CUCU|nr:hypothetical protein Zmor_003065 [Zophobas morio]
MVFLCSAFATQPYRTELKYPCGHCMLSISVFESSEPEAALSTQGHRTTLIGFSFLSIVTNFFSQIVFLFRFCTGAGNKGRIFLSLTGVLFLSRPLMRSTGDRFLRLRYPGAFYEWKLAPEQPPPERTPTSAKVISSSTHSNVSSVVRTEPSSPSSTPGRQFRFFKPSVPCIRRMILGSGGSTRLAVGGWR